jgi:hypothetical protein
VLLSYTQVPDVTAMGVLVQQLVQNYSHAMAQMTMPAVAVAPPQPPAEAEVAQAPAPMDTSA